MNPVELEVITPILGNLDHCCEVYIDGAGVGASSRPLDLAYYPPSVQAEFDALSDLLLDLRHRYGSHLIIRVADPASVRGLWKSVRHRVRRYPTFIVDDQEQICGLDPSGIDRVIRLHLAPKTPRAD